MTRISPRTACALLGLALLAGCGSTRIPAPVREASQGAVRPVKLQPSLPPGQHRVNPGDTLYQIAFGQGLDYRDLAAWNGLPDPDHIVAGSVLRLTAPSPAVTTTALPPAPGALAQPIPAAPIQSSVPVELPPALWSWPSKGELIARFGTGLNKGVDIAGRKGQPVQAAADGRVVYAGGGLRGYGKLIIIRHGKTLLSAYAHQARIVVREGQDVARGQAIGEMGDTDAERVKLHFEIREHGKPVDPLNYLPNAGGSE